MKKLLLAATITGLSAACFAQGVVDFGNAALSVNVDLGTSPTHSTALAPAGSFVAALYWASSGTTGMTVNNSTLVIATNAPTSFGAGVFEAHTVTVPQVGGAAGSLVGGEFIVAGWEGTQTTYAAAQSAGDVIGATAEFTNDVGPGGQAPYLPNLTGWTSDLILSAAPEPTTIAVAGLGAASLLLFRRKK